jgi:hypothetical protein
MSRYLRHAVLAALATLALAVPAQAAIIDYTSTFNPADVLFDSSGGSCTGTNFEDATLDTVSGQSGGKCNDLQYDHTLVGYTSGLNTLISAQLRLFLYDDHDPSNPNSQGNPESVIITLDPTLATENIIGEVALNNNTNTTLTYNVFSQVEPDGTLTVRLAVGAQGGGQNDFFFAGSQLFGEWEDVLLIPEPASLLLFGGGLASLALRARRRTRSRA